MTDGRLASGGAVHSGAVLIGRLLLAGLFLLEGWSKLRGYGPAAAYMERFSVPGSLLPLVILVELGGGALIAVGWRTRLAALALAAFCVAAAFLFHAGFADRGQVIHFEKDLAIAGGLLLLAAFGPGRYALDGRRAGSA